MRSHSLGALAANLRVKLGMAVKKLKGEAAASIIGATGMQRISSCECSSAMRSIHEAHPERERNSLRKR
jgi:hypothetical protein